MCSLNTCLESRTYGRSVSVTFIDLLLLGNSFMIQKAPFAVFVSLSETITLFLPPDNLLSGGGIITFSF